METIITIGIWILIGLILWLLYTIRQLNKTCNEKEDRIQELKKTLNKK